MLVLLPLQQHKEEMFWPEKIFFGARKDMCLGRSPAGWEAQFRTALNNLVVDTAWTPQNSSIDETNLIWSVKLRLGHSHHRGVAK